MALNAHRLLVLSRLEALGTVRAVAAALHLSPSAVSAALAALEAETGTRLLTRVGRGVELTPAGRRLAGHARGILDRMDAAEADVRALTTEPVGRVRVGAFSSAVRALGLPLLDRLRSEHPRIVVEFRELDPHDSTPALRRGDCDLIVTADVPDVPRPVDPDVTIVPLLTDDIVLVCSASSAGGTDPVDLLDRADDLWSTDLPDSYLAVLITTLCRRSGFEPEIVGRFTSFELLLAHVEAGHSVSLLPVLAVDARYRVQVQPLEIPVSRSVYAATRNTARTVAVDVVMDALRDVAATHRGMRTPVPHPDADAPGNQRMPESDE